MGLQVLWVCLSVKSGCHHACCTQELCCRAPPARWSLSRSPTPAPTCAHLAGLCWGRQESRQDCGQDWTGCVCPSPGNTTAASLCLPGLPHPPHSACRSFRHLPWASPLGHLLLASSCPWAISFPPSLRISSPEHLPLSRPCSSCSWTSHPGQPSSPWAKLHWDIFLDNLLPPCAAHSLVLLLL